MFCPHCGAQLPDGTAFCTSCGQPTTQQAPGQQPYQQAPGQQPYQQAPGQQTYQQPYQQQPYQQQPTGSGNNMLKDFDPKELSSSFAENVKKPAEWGLPTYIALGGAFLCFIGMFLPYLSAKGFSIVSVSFMSSGAFHIILAWLFILLVDFTGIAKKGLPMICAGGVLLLFSIIEGIANSSAYTSLSVGFIFMLLGSIAAVAGGVLKFLNEKKGL